MAVRSIDRRRPPIHVPRLLSVLGALLLALVMAGLPSPASAHGVAMVPGSRTYLCYLELIASGHQAPSNPACAAAFAQTGGTPLYNWFAVLDSNAGGRSVGYVPDGKLCSAGDRSPYNFSSYNATRSDWPKTHLTAGSSVQVKYSNWAAHPGKFNVYITKDGWTPSKSLAWGDLSLIQTVTNPPQSGSAGSNGGNYHWNLQLPSGKSGQHMIFMQWIRSDSQENFFSCSDVVFDGGNGQVTGLGNGEMSAQEVVTTGEEFKNTKAAPVHVGHEEHAAHAGAVGEVALAASANDSSASPPTVSVVSLAGAVMMIFIAGATAYGRRRRGQAEQRH